MYNKAVVIVGALGKIGKEITKLLISKGFSLILFDKEISFTEYKYYDNKIVIFNQEVSDVDKFKRCLNKAKQTLNVSIGYVIVASGLMSYNRIEYEDIEKYEELLQQNVIVPIIVTKSIINEMQENNFGRIIFLSSTLSRLSIPSTSAYTMSKQALNSFVKILAAENKEKNITVNCVAPGLIKGEFCRGFLSEMLNEHRFINSFIDMNHIFVDIKQVAHTVLFLIDNNCYNGEVLYLDNGYSLN